MLLGGFDIEFVATNVARQSQGKGQRQRLGLSDVETRGNEAILKQSLVRAIVRGMRDQEQRLEC